MIRSTCTSSISSLYAKAFQSNAMKWAVGSWSFFIAENLLLTENRSIIIDKLFHGNEEQYHYLYGLLSTIACGSIGYAYVYKILPSASLYLLWPVGSPVPPYRQLSSFLLYSLGLGILSQVPPKLQLPVTYSTSSTSTTATASSSITKQQQQQQWRVRCPFDFTHETTNSSSNTEEAVRGIDRISRHPGLWSLGLIGLGQACVTSSIPKQIWWCMPTMVAAIGGWHIDSRYRRGLGGTMPSESWEEQTSHIPFLALLRKDCTSSIQAFYKECKGSNAVVAITVAAGIVLRQGRGGGVAHRFKNISTSV